MSKLPPTKLFEDNIDELITKAVSEPVYESNLTESSTFSSRNLSVKRNYYCNFMRSANCKEMGIITFKDTKRGGWGWHQTKMVDPERAERLWLAIAVATLWAVSVGGEGDANLPVSSLEVLPQTHVARRTATRGSRPRMVSCFARGIITIVGRLIRGDGLVVGRFVPEPWPTRPSVPKKKNTKSNAHVAQEPA